MNMSFIQKFLGLVTIYVIVAILLNTVFSTAQLALGGIILTVGWLFWIYVCYEVRESKRRSKPDQIDYQPVHDFLEEPKYADGDFVVFYYAKEIPSGNYSDCIPGGKVLSTFVKDRKKFLSVESRYNGGAVEQIARFDIEESRVRRKVELDEIRNFYVDASDGYSVKSLVRPAAFVPPAGDKEVTSEAIDIKA